MDDPSIGSEDEYSHSQPLASKRAKYEESKNSEDESIQIEEKTMPSSSSAVAIKEHYNQLKEKGLSERFNSNIFYLRNFNNWIKRYDLHFLFTCLKARSSTKLIYIYNIPACSLATTWIK